jgi:hypothetical protein
MTREEGDRFEDLAERNQWLLTVEQAEWLWAMHARMRRGAQDRGVGAQWHSDDTARMRP